MPNRVSWPRHFAFSLLASYALCTICARAGEPAKSVPFKSASELPPISDLPDPRQLANGQRISTPGEWADRRLEVKATLAHYFSGHLPLAPGKIAVEALASRKVPGANYQLLKLTFGAANALTLEVAVFIPLQNAGPSPTLIVLSSLGTPGAQPPSGVTEKYRATTPEEFAESRRDALQRGYALVTYYFQQGASDQANNHDGPFYKTYPNSDAGTLAVWSWMFSRCVDFLQTVPWADARRLGVVGHSRLGKTALLAGALDERVALVVAAGSGFGGTGAMRVSGKARGGKEGLEEATQRFPYWFEPHLKEFANQVDRLPFDANWTMSLVAPRALLDLEAYDDPYCNGAAAVAAFDATAEIYHFLHVDDRLGLHFRAGGHALTDEDWGMLLDFADHELKNLPPSRDFRAAVEKSRLH